jgi:hypothetical protein
VRARIAIALGLAALVVYMNTAQVEPAPEPVPYNQELDLRGAFISETASEDAQLLAAMATEIADVIEFDGGLETPSMQTATAFDSLRTRSREFLCRGESIGDRQPRVRKLVSDYLDEKLGNSGGVVTDAQRKQWINCYREIGEASRAAVQAEP